MLAREHDAEVGGGAAEVVQDGKGEGNRGDRRAEQRDRSRQEELTEVALREDAQSAT